MLRARLAALVLVIGCMFAVPVFSYAQSQVTVSQGYSNIMTYGIIFANICPDPDASDGVDTCAQCRDTGICSLSQVLQLVVNVIIFILGISGSVALLMFFYGGWNWIFAQGRTEYIQTGKDTMKHAIIGLAIIFGAYAIVNFVIALLGGISPGATIEDTINGLDTKQNGKSVEENADEVLQSY